MYHYIQDKDFLRCLKSVCADIVNQLVQSINNDSIMTVKACLVGSGAKNLITQNASNPVDLDYNICVIHTVLDSEREIKEYIQKKFNRVLNANGWKDCQDSTSALTTEKRVFQQGNKTAFSIDLAITKKYNHSWHRLIHEKTGWVNFDRYYWNQVQDSRQLEERVKAIKSFSAWNEVRDTYLDKKNLYLQRNDSTHSSFVIYTESVNEIYYRIKEHIL